MSLREWIGTPTDWAWALGSFAVAMAFTFGLQVFAQTPTGKRVCAWIERRGWA
jgi:hypothetical protein